MVKMENLCMFYYNYISKIILAVEWRMNRS